VIIINAHEEFSPPKLGLLTPKQVYLKARLPNPARNQHGLAVIMITKLSLFLFAGFAVINAKPIANPARELP
jgi:hypothetical protein